MFILKKVNRQIPNVLIAVIITTFVSWLFKYKKNRNVELQSVQSQTFTIYVLTYNSYLEQLDSLMAMQASENLEYKNIQKKEGIKSITALENKSEIALLEFHIGELNEKIQNYRELLRDYELNGEIIEGSAFQKGSWHLKVGSKKLNPQNLTLIGGGAVVGNIPRGLPHLHAPKISLGTILELLPMAIIISLIGFMEAISIAKAISTYTNQRIDPNRELIGQGLSNIAGSFSQCYPVSGSFSRSAVNLQAGAVTGLSNVIGSMVVMITLLFFTPLLYHLPQSVLAAIIMMAVASLINYKGFLHAYQAQKYDGIFALVTFIATLIFAPHLDKGIMVGVVLSIGYFLDGANINFQWDLLP